LPKRNTLHFLVAACAAGDRSYFLLSGNAILRAQGRLDFRSYFATATWKEKSCTSNSGSNSSTPWSPSAVMIQSHSLPLR